MTSSKSLFCLSFPHLYKGSNKYILLPPKGSCQDEFVTVREVLEYLGCTQHKAMRKSFCIFYPMQVSNGMQVIKQRPRNGPLGKNVLNGCLIQELLIWWTDQMERIYTIIALRSLSNCICTRTNNLCRNRQP